MRNIEENPYIIVSDDDGHRFIIPEELEANFNSWVDAANNDRESPFSFDEYRIYSIGRLRIYEWEEV